MSTPIRSRVLLSLAIMRELHNKVNHYRAMINRNIKQYTEYKEKIHKITPEKIADVDKEIEVLKVIDSRLNNVSMFLESIILRFETLVLAGNSVVAALAVKDIVKILRQYMKGVPPVLVVLVDKLDEVSKSLMQELKVNYDVKAIVSQSSSEVSKIIDEAKKVAGLT
ncbi:MAG: hypothetical protein QW775_05010 [Ignisphaera sp.]|uniref:Uncharacterized protein n=1 Tax=Ignisphaera aggregans TaxID=334771 RepID=A0A7C4NJ96_9CREN